LRECRLSIYFDYEDTARRNHWRCWKIVPRDRHLLRLLPYDNRTGRLMLGILGIRLVFEPIPCELRGRRQWFFWKFVQRDGRRFRIFYDSTGNFADVTNSESGTTLKGAIVGCLEHDAVGVAYFDP
jgi:hypothetical protein